MTRALIVVDMQRDFCEGGALAVSGTLPLLQPLQDFIAQARRVGVKIAFTQDWHPRNHSSFQVEGGPWPIHCVANSLGAQLMPPLTAQPGDLQIHKGESVVGAGYSGFEGTTLGEQLKSLAVNDVAVCGVATEYCVRATALDAIEAGFHVTVLTDLVRPVAVSATPGALEDMVAAGASVANSAAWL